MAIMTEVCSYVGAGEWGGVSTCGTTVTDASTGRRRRRARQRRRNFSPFDLLLRHCETLQCVLMASRTPRQILLVKTTPHPHQVPGGLLSHAGKKPRTRLGGLVGLVVAPIGGKPVADMLIIVLNRSTAWGNYARRINENKGKSHFTTKSHHPSDSIFLTLSFSTVSSTSALLLRNSFSSPGPLTVSSGGEWRSIDS